jgi:hypothetical protein
MGAAPVQPWHIPIIAQACEKMNPTGLASASHPMHAQEQAARRQGIPTLFVGCRTGMP